MVHSSIWAFLRQQDNFRLSRDESHKDRNSSPAVPSRCNTFVLGSRQNMSHQMSHRGCDGKKKKTLKNLILVVAPLRDAVSVATQITCKCDINVMFLSSSFNLSFIWIQHIFGPSFVFTDSPPPPDSPDKQTEISINDTSRCLCQTEINLQCNYPLTHNR